MFIAEPSKENWDGLCSKTLELLYDFGKVLGFFLIFIYLYWLLQVLVMACRWPIFIAACRIFLVEVCGT